MAHFAESVVEVAAFAWLEALDFGVLYGTHITADEPVTERSDPKYHDMAPKTRISGELRGKDHSRLAEAAA